MTNEQHEKAKYIKYRIKSLNDGLEFMNELFSADPDEIVAKLKPQEFGNSGRCVYIQQCELAVIIKAYEAERERLEQEFAML